MVETAVRAGAEMEEEPVTAMVIPSLGQQLAQLSEEDQRLLTTDVIMRWARDLAPEDVDLYEIVDLERKRLRQLNTMRSMHDLTDLEWQTVRYLQKHERKPRTYYQIAHHLWSTPEHPITPASLRRYNGYPNSRVTQVQVLLCSIRKKLEIDPLRPQHFATIRGVGYCYFSQPPSLHDGIDYAARRVEHARLREIVYRTMGPIEGDGLVELPDHWEPGAPMLGPEHPSLKGASGPN